MAKTKPSDNPAPISPSRNPGGSDAQAAGEGNPPAITPQSAVDRSPSEDRDLALKAMRAMYGLGNLDAGRRLDKYDDATIAAMAEQERIGRRDRIPAILAKATPKPTK